MLALCPTEDSADIHMTTSPSQYRLATEVEQAQPGTAGCHYSYLNKSIHLICSSRRLGARFRRAACDPTVGLMAEFSDITHPRWRKSLDAGHLASTLGFWVTGSI